jgi:hypothetical protein
MKKLRFITLCSALVLLLAGLSGSAQVGGSFIDPPSESQYYITLSKDDELIEWGDTVTATLYFQVGSFKPMVCKGPFKCNWYYVKSGGISVMLPPDVSFTNEDPNKEVRSEVKIPEDESFDSVMVDFIYNPGTPDEVVIYTSFLLYKPVECILSLSPEDILIGETLTATIKNSGGVHPLDYHFKWIIRKEGGVEEVVREQTYSGPRGTYEDSFAIPECVSGTVVATVTDKRGNTSSLESVFWIRPFMAIIKLDTDWIEAGERITAIASYKGDPALPVKCEIGFRIREANEWHYLDPKDVTGPLYEIRQTIPFGDRLGVEVVFTDANKVSVWRKKEIPIIGSTPNPLSGTATLSSTEVGHGERLTVFYPDAKGGTPPYSMQMHFTIAKDGQVIKQFEDSIKGTQWCGFFTAGDRGDVICRLLDADGRVGNDSLDFTLKPPVIKRGDANKDGKVDIADLTAIIDYLKNPRIPCPSMNNADMDANGKVEVADVLALIGQLVGK